MTEFKVGDIVRRKSSKASTAYKVRHDPFRVVSTNGGYVTDVHGGCHYPDNLELVPIDDIPEYLWQGRPRVNIVNNPPAADPVNHPTHYKTAGGLEAIDVIEEFGLGRDFRLGNAAKYLLRAGKKDDELQDIKKAIWYLQRYVVKKELAE